MVSYLTSTSGGRWQNIIVGPPGAESTDGAPVFWASETDPEYTIHCTVYSCSDMEGQRVNIPVGAKPTPAYDKHMTVVQADGMEYDFWESSIPSGTGGTLNVSSGGRTRIDGDSTGSNADAGQTGLPAGQITTREWMDNRINHALELTIYRTKASSVYPVQESGCGGHLAATDPTSPVPNGQWFKLNVTDAEIAAQPLWRQSIYRAMRDYGMFVVDTGSIFNVEHDNEMTYMGKRDPALDWLVGQADVSVNTRGQAVARNTTFPFSKLVALNPPPAAHACTAPNDG